MSQTGAADRSMIRYLLGQLPDAERDELEDRYFSDDEVHEQLLAVEEELIDAYVHEALTPEDKACFESRFLTSPERRQKIEFARALAAANRRPRWEWRAFLSLLIPQSTGMRLAFAGAAAAAILVALFVWPYLWRGTNPRNTPPIQAKSAPPKANEPIPTPTGPAKRETAPILAPILAFALTPGVRGEGAGNVVAIPPGTYRIRLELHLDAADFPEYAAVVQTADGNPIWHEGKLRPHPAGTGATVLVTIPPGLLAPGEYTVKLSGVSPTGTEEVAGYGFRVR